MEESSKATIGIIWGIALAIPTIMICVGFFGVFFGFYTYERSQIREPETYWLMTLFVTILCTFAGFWTMVLMDCQGHLP